MDLREWKEGRNVKEDKKFFRYFLLSEELKRIKRLLLTSFHPCEDDGLKLQSQNLCNNKYL